MYKLESVINKLKNLPQYKKLSEEDLLTVAKEKQKEWDENFDVEIMFIDAKEKKLGRGLLRKYLKDYTIETISDKNMLKQLIFLEIVGIRLQAMLNDLKKVSGKNRVDSNILDSLHKNIKEVTALKDKMGLISQDGQSDSFKTLQLLKRKFQIWREENNGSRTVICPYCGQMVLLKIRTDAWEEQKHPFFKDRVLANEHLLKMYKEGKISQKDVALVLECSTDYIDWMIKKVKF